MDLQKKLEYTKSNLRSISEHRDVDASVRKAALDIVAQELVVQSAMIDAEIAAQVKDLSASVQQS